MSRSSYPTVAELALFAAGLIAGLSGETLLFMRNQCRAIEGGLREDFRVVLFLRSELSEGKLKILEEKVRALPGIEDLRYVSKDEAMESLRRDDPELVESVALVGENPLASAFEVRPAPEALGRVPKWASDAYGGLPEIGEIRYKSEQLRAVLLARFFGHCLGLVLNALLCLGGLILAFGSWLLFPPRLTRAALRRAALSAGGAALGMAAIYALVHPMRMFSAWWAWPGTFSQLLLAAAAAAGGAVAEPPAGAG